MKRFIHKTFQALILAALLFLAGRSIWSLFQDKTISLPEINKSNNVNPPVKKMSSVSSIIKNTVNSNKVAVSSIKFSLNISLIFIIAIY